MKKLNALIALSALSLVGLAGCANDGGETGNTFASASASNSNTNGDGDGDGDGDTDGFVNNPDGGAESTCDPWTQDCPDGEKCAAVQSEGGDTWDSNQCVPINGNKNPGDECVYDGALAGTDDCNATSMCWNGVCTEYCTGNADNPICPMGHSCSIANDGSIILCLPGCDPLLQDCGNMEGCYWDGMDHICGPAPAEGNGLLEGDDCMYINDCTPGLTCVGAEFYPNCGGTGCCSPWCDTTEDPDPCTAPGTECTAWFEEGMAPPGKENVGVCALPG